MKEWKWNAGIGLWVDHMCQLKIYSCPEGNFRPIPKWLFQLAQKGGVKERLNGNKKARIQPLRRQSFVTDSTVFLVFFFPLLEYPNICMWFASWHAVVFLLRFKIHVRVWERFHARSGSIWEHACVCMCFMDILLGTVAAPRVASFFGYVCDWYKGNWLIVQCWETDGWHWEEVLVHVLGP